MHNRPMAFCTWIDFSGVSKRSEPSVVDLKVTPEIMIQTIINIIMIKFINYHCFFWDYHFYLFFITILNIIIFINLM